MTDTSGEPASRAQRIIAFMIAGLVIASLVCFAVSMIGYATGAVAGEVGTFWVVMVMLPYIALPIALVLTVTLLIMSARRRARTNRNT